MVFPDYLYQNGFLIFFWFVFEMIIFGEVLIPLWILLMGRSTLSYSPQRFKQNDF